MIKLWGQIIALLDWYAELNDGTIEAQSKRDVLDGVIDLIIDNIN